MMIFLVMIIACILGAIVGLNAPMISYTYSSYLAIAIIAALDSVFGGIASVINKKFDMKIFISGFFGNAILAILLTMLGEKLNVDIYLAAIVVFVWRMFMNLGIIRRYYVEKWTEKIERKTDKKEKCWFFKDYRMYYKNVTKILQKYNKFYWHLSKNVIYIHLEKLY